MISFTSFLALAAFAPQITSATVNQCPEFKKTLFKASFALASSSPEKTSIRIGDTAESSEPVAQIWKEGKCQAVCSTRYFDQHSSHLPIALAMECTSADFDPLNVPATVLWPTTGQKPAILRFGSWVNGYRDFPLRVELDRYSSNRKLLSQR